MVQKSLSKENSFLTVKEAASFLNLSVPTIKNYIYTGKLKSIKTPGGHHRIRLSDLTTCFGIPSKESLINEVFLNVIAGLIRVIEKREIFNQGHAESVAHLSQEVAKELKLTEIQINDVLLAALLHDIGKINIEEGILNKPSSLTNEELRILKRHPEVGEEIVESIYPIKRLSSIIRQHHEWYDGKGYPDGLQGGEIQIGARIIAVAEAFDFMTQKKPYRNALPHALACLELKRGANSQFDPEIVEVFLRLQKKKKK